MRIAFDLVAVHVSAGIAFVRVADEVFLVGLCLGQEVPLVARQESGTAAAAKFGGLDLFDHHLGSAVNEDTVKCLVAAYPYVFFNVIRIDEPAIAQNDLLLAFEEWHFVPQRYFGVSVAVPDI